MFSLIFPCDFNALYLFRQESFDTFSRPIGVANTDLKTPAHGCHCVLFSWKEDQPDQSTGSSTRTVNSYLR